MRKNILIFCHGYNAPFVDVNNQYTQLFSREKYHVTVVYLDGEPNETVRKRHHAERVIFMNSPKRSTGGLKLYAIKKMLQLQRDNAFEIVICHRYKPTYIMLWVARFYSIPALFSIMHEFKTLHAWTRKVSLGLLAKKNLLLAGVSNTVRDELRQAVWKIPPTQIITLYNAIDIQAAEPALLERDLARQYFNLSPTDFIFGTIGRLVPAKDQQTAIQAFAAIKLQCPSAKLIIIGKGELETVLKKQIADLNLTNDILMTGYVDKAFQYLKAFDTFLLPSIKEAFGRVLLEAMVAKVPIIATNINGIPEVVDQTGMLVPPKQPAALAQAMQTLYQAPKEHLAQQGEAGYQRVTQVFSLQRFHETFWTLPLIKKFSH